MTFTESVSVCFKKYFVFEGRASRSEYWWFQLIVVPSYIIFEITNSAEVQQIIEYSGSES